MKNKNFIVVTIILGIFANHSHASERAKKEELNNQLFLALKNLDVNKAQKLLAAGADPNAKLKLEVGNETTIFNHFIYRNLVVIKLRDPKMKQQFQELLSILCKSRIIFDELGQSVFQGQFSNSSLEMIETLYQCMGKLAFESKAQFDLMAQYAISNQDDDQSIAFLEWLLKHGMNINQQLAGNNLVFYSIDALNLYPNRFDHYYKIIKFLLDRGTDIGITQFPEEDIFYYLKTVKQSIKEKEYQKLLALFEEPVKKYIQEVSQTGPTGAPRPLPTGVSSIIGEYLVGVPAASAPEQPKETPKSAVVSEKDVPEVE